MELLGVLIILSIGIATASAFIYLFAPLWKVAVIILPAFLLIYHLEWWSIVPALYWVGLTGYVFKSKPKA
ncbi:hypothetical protein RCC89_04270 [Cytophagaceae bacterium ABcell3]|nr:hypothetical protein RCC89_04270 [Cytophagaceae bacterium ABcell3]